MWGFGGIMYRDGGIWLEGGEDGQLLSDGNSAPRLDDYPMQSTLLVPGRLALQAELKRRIRRGGHVLTHGSVPTSVSPTQIIPQKSNTAWLTPICIACRQSYNPGAHTPQTLDAPTPSKHQ